MIGTATYQGSFEGFGLTRKEDGKPGEEGEFFTRDEAKECMRCGIEVVREAFEKAEVGRKAGSDEQRLGITALSLGPLGATLIPGAEYSGLYPDEMTGKDKLRDWHLERLKVFFDEGEVGSRNGMEEKKSLVLGRPDIVIAFETLPRRDEIEGVRAAMGILGLGVKKRRDGSGEALLSLPPFWISCVFPREDERLPDGSTVEELVEAIMGCPSPIQPLPSGIGINCTKLYKLRSLILSLESSITTLSPNTAQPLFHLVLYPDGAPNHIYDTITQTWVPKPTTANDKSDQQTKSWAEMLEEIVNEVVHREKERRKDGKGIWRGILVGGCCMVSVDGIEELRERVLRDGAKYCR